MLLQFHALTRPQRSPSRQRRSCRHPCRSLTACSTQECAMPCEKQCHLPPPISQPSCAARVRRVAFISREARGLGDESSAQHPQRGSLSRQPHQQRHLEPLSEVPIPTTHPSETPQTPHLPYRHLERKYDQSVIPSGCSVEAHSVETTNLNCAAPAHRNRVSHIAVRLQRAPTVSVHRNRAFGAARARARRLKNGMAGRRPSQLCGGASFPMTALPHYLMRTPNASATRTIHVQPITHTHVVAPAPAQPK